MILITGATGKLGTHVIRTLLAKTPASEIAAFVRDGTKAAHYKEQGVSVRVGEYDDTGSLDAAMQGVGKVLLISGGGVNGLQQHKNVVDAAKRAGVACIAYTGRALHDRDTLANALMVRHFQTEDYIKESGLHYVLFRNILYMDVLPIYTGPAVLEEGAFHLPPATGRVSYALRSEMGEAIANVLLEGDCDNETYHFTGSEVYSFEDVAVALSELSGKPVKFNSIPTGEYAVRMQAKGQPPFVVNMMAGFMTDIEAGQEAMISDDLERAIGRKPASLKEGLKVLYNL